MILLGREPGHQDRVPRSVAQACRAANGRACQTPVFRPAPTPGANLF